MVGEVGRIQWLVMEVPDPRVPIRPDLGLAIRTLGDGVVVVEPHVIGIAAQAIDRHPDEGQALRIERLELIRKIGAIRRDEAKVLAVLLHRREVDPSGTEQDEDRERLQLSR